MATARPWPTKADWARMDAIALANQAIINIDKATPQIGNLAARLLLADAKEKCYKIKISMITVRGDREEQ